MILEQVYFSKVYALAGCECCGCQRQIDNACGCVVCEWSGPPTAFYLIVSLLSCALILALIGLGLTAPGN